VVSEVVVAPLQARQRWMVAQGLEPRTSAV
jgi:hypothetical protein